MAKEIIDSPEKEVDSTTQQEKKKSKKKAEPVALDPERFTR